MSESTRDEYVRKYGLSAVCRANGEDHKERMEDLRDWYAGMALQGIIAASPGYTLNGNVIGETEAEEIAADAFAHADAMLKERG